MDLPLPFLLYLLLLFFASFLQVRSQVNPALTCLIEKVKIPVPGSSIITPHGLYAEWMSNFVMSPDGADFSTCNYMCSNDCTKSCLIRGQDLTGMSCPVVWGNLEAPLNSSDYEKAPDLQMYPIHGSAIVPVYNLGFTMEPELVLSGQVLAQIFMCEIKNWRDPQIISLNSGPDQLCPGGDLDSANCLLPNTNITIFIQGANVYTETFTRAMYTFSEEWRQLYGPPKSTWPSALISKCGLSSVLPPYSTAIGIRNSIGYATYSQFISTGAGRYARMLNKDGYVVAANSTFVRTSMINANWDWPKFTANLIDQPGESWPICFLYYTGLKKNSTEQVNKCDRVRGALTFLDWSLTASRALTRTEESGYATLPSELSEQVLQRMKSEVYCDGIPAFISHQFDVGVLLPETGTSNGFQVQVWKDLIKFGVDKLNKGNMSLSNGNGLRDWKIRLDFEDSKNTQADAILQATSLINKGKKAVLGEFTDLLTNTVQVVLAGVSLCQVSAQTEAERPKTLIDSSELVRMRQPSSSQNQVILGLMEKIGWKKATVLFTTTNEDSVVLSQRIMEEWYQNSNQSGIDLQRVALTSMKDDGLVERELEMILDSGVRVIISVIPNDGLQLVLDVGERVGIVDQGYTWLFVLLDDPIDGTPIFVEEDQQKRGPNQQKRETEKDQIVSEKLEGSFLCVNE